MTAIRPFELAIPEDQLVALADRHDQTRWPEEEPVDEWSQGMRLAALRELVAYWRIEYDWRRCEARITGGSARGIHLSAMSASLESSLEVLQRSHAAYRRAREVTHSSSSQLSPGTPRTIERQPSATSDAANVCHGGIFEPSPRSGAE